MSQNCLVWGKSPHIWWLEVSEVKCSMWKLRRDTGARVEFFLNNPKSDIPSSARGSGTSLVAQWLRIRLPVQWTWVQALVWEDPTCRGATKPVCHNYWACVLEPASHNYRAHVPQLLKPAAPRAGALQREKPPQWEARARQWRVAPARHN